MAFNEKLPKWDNAGVEPPESKKTEGWQPTEKPPAQWFNWIFNRIYKALEEIRSKAFDKADIVNNLTTDEVTKALSANQGKVLNDGLVAHKAEKATRGELGHIKLQEAWLTATLQNGWTVAGNGLLYAKNDLDIVTILFHCTAGTVVGLTNISNIPAAYRPMKETVFPLLDSSAGTTNNHNLYIHTDGRVRIAAGSDFITDKVYQGQISYYTNI